MKMKTKQCSKCKDTKSLDAFSTDASKSNGKKSYCRECDNSHKRERLVKDYGITLAQYDIMVDQQEGVCAICGEINVNGKRLVIDHNHDTGEIRGLLCSACNLGLGHFKDSTAALKSAINYLSRRD